MKKPSRHGDRGGRKSDIALIVFFVALAGIALGGAFSVGIYSGYRKNIIFQVLNETLDNTRAVFSELRNVLLGSEPTDFLQPARNAGSGVTINEVGDDGNLVVMSGFFDGSNGIRLIRRSGEVLADWPASFHTHFPDDAFLGGGAPATDRNVDLHGLVMEPDGSVIFNYEYYGTVKLDRCGAVVWRLPHRTHHSIERASGGGYWIPGRTMAPAEEVRRKYSPFGTRNTEDMAIDTILRVSPEGEITENVELLDILFKSGLEPVLTSTGYGFHKPQAALDDINHLNKIAELTPELASAFPEFPAGALLLSLRERNMIAVVDPGTWRVLWYQIGPWRRQHDPEFRPDGGISMFNNNRYRTVDTIPEAIIDNPPGWSNITAVDPRDGETEILYGDATDEHFRSRIRGKHDLVPNGDILITEFEAGRAFEVNESRQVVWEYINRFDDTRVLELTEARLYPESYFDVDTWSCEKP